MHGHRAIRVAILSAFALIMGQFVWRTFGPPTAPDYFVGGLSAALVGPHPDARHLYLRQKIYFSERPRHAWLQTMTRGRVRIYVNGRLLADRSPDGYMGVVLVDPTPLLKVGANVIAIAAEQYSPKRCAMVTFDGAYTLADGEHLLAAAQSWRCSDKFERGTDWWFMPDFDDRNWPLAGVVQEHFCAAVKTPPRAITEPAIGRWIIAADWEQPVASFRRQFEIDARPRQGWLRLTTNALFRIAVNDVVLDVHEETLGLSKLSVATERSYDITPLLRKGINSIALAMQTPAGPPRFICDLEAEDVQGKFYRIGSDSQWLSNCEPQAKWLTDASSPASEWKPCRVESGYLDVMPWDVLHSFMALSMPVEAWAVRCAGYFATTACVFVMSWMCCGVAGRLLAIGQRERLMYSASGMAWFALIPATIMLVGGWLATHDPRVAQQDVYRVSWIALAASLIPLQWLLFAIFQVFGRRAADYGQTIGVRKEDGMAEEGSARVELPPKSSWSGRSVVAALVVILFVGFIIRLPGVANRPLGADEVNMYRCVQGVYERGFPSFVVHENLAPQYISTSELVYVGGALAHLFFDSDRYVIRFPSVCWGTLTILVIYAAGRRMFHPVVGLLAAALYALSPIAIAMANFGRYPSQLQFFTTLTIYLFWRTVAGGGKVRPGYLLLTTLSTIAMFLSWEPSLLVAPGMIVAALLARRGRLETLLRDGWVWCALLAVALTLMLQMAHRDFKQAQRMNYGTGASDVALMPMWRYANFDIAHFLKAASWSQGDTLPMVGLLGALVFAVRSAFLRSVRFLLLILLITSGIIALGLPVDADRYSYFLTPLLILVASAAAVLAARSLRKLIRPDAPALWTRYARGMARITVLITLVLAIELTEATAEWDGSWESLNPFAESTRYLAGPGDFLIKNIQQGDVVLATQPYLLDHQMDMATKGKSRLNQDSTYWIQSRLHLQAVLDDLRPLPLNRRDGTIMVANLEALTTVFARPNRIWLLVEKGHFNRLNGDEVDAFLRQNMDVVFEDFESVVLLRDTRHRPAAVRHRDEKTLSEAQTDFLLKNAVTIPWNSSGISVTSGLAPSPTRSQDDGGSPERQERP